MKEKVKIEIILHPSIPIKKEKIEKEVEKGITIKEAIIKTLKEEKEAYEYLVKEEKIRPGFLILNNKIELKTTGKINKKIEEEMKIRIIPISHGG